MKGGVTYLWDRKDWPAFVVLEDKRGEREVFERVGECRHERTFNLVKRECDGERYEWHGDELPKRCPSCGAKVVSADD